MRPSSRIERWLDAPSNAELHPTLHHPNGAPYQFDERRVRALVIEWQSNQRPELLNQILLSAQPLLSGVILSRSTYVEDFDETLGELRWRIYQVKTTLSDSFEFQRWLVRGMVSTDFGLRRHEGADSMSLVFELTAQRSRQIFDHTLLEVRRQLLDVVEMPAVTRANLTGTRGHALAKYCDQLSAQDFAKLAFLMRGLSPTAIITEGHLDWVLDGFPNARPLFSSEFGSRVDHETRHHSQTRP